MRPDRRRLLIVAALVVLLGVVGWTYFGAGGGTPAATPAASGPRRSAPAAGTAEPLPSAEAVRLASLTPDRGEPAAATRNPFRFERRSTAAAKPPEAAPVFAPATPEPPVPAGPPPPPPIPLKFIGVVEKGDGARWAVLSVGDGRAPLHGKEGDIIDGRYRILKIGTESIDLVYLDGRGRQTIRLTGQ
jgi:hypothetical protein